MLEIVDTNLLRCPILRITDLKITEHIGRTKTEKVGVRRMRKKFILNAIPLLFHAICFIVCICGISKINMYIRLIEIVINTLFIPIYLTVINCKSFKNLWKNILVYFLMIIIISIGIGTIFLSWWLPQVIRVPSRVLIDSDTMLIIELQAWCALLNLSISWFIAKIIMSIVGKRQK